MILLNVLRPLFCAHSWLNWVDEDDDEDEVGLKEKPEDTRYIKKDYIEIRPEAPGVWTKDLINFIPMYCHHWDCGLKTSTGASSLMIPTGV